VFRALERQARRALGPAAGRVGIERSADVRYVGQSWDLSVPWPFSGDVRRPFEAAHARRFGYARPEEPIEVVTLRVRAAGLPAIDLPPPPPLEPDRPGRTRLVTDAGEPMEAPVRLRASLAPGEAVAGPAILTEPDSTIYVAPRWLARVGPWGDLILTREENQPPHR
jgi:N-methylhydantoinase A